MLLLLALLIQGASRRALADGGSDSPDATARPVTINFDTVPTNVPLPANQYQIASFSSYAGGTISTAYDAGLGGSYPNGIISTSGSGYNYWPNADVYLSFVIPVNGLTFWVLGARGGGAAFYVDVFVNNAYYQTFYWFSATGTPGQVFPPTLINLSGIQHITRIAIHNADNCNDNMCILRYPLYYDASPSRRN